MKAARMSNGKPLGQTPSQTVGPYFAYSLTPAQYGYDWSSIADPDMIDEATPGQRITVEGQVLDGADQPITDALIELWHADAQGRYVNQHEANGRFTGFGRCGTGTLTEGHFRFRTIRPAAISPTEAPHINVILTMRGLLLHVFTRIYFAGEMSNETDPVLLQVPAARRATLIATETAPGMFSFNIRMQGDHETVFLDI